MASQLTPSPMAADRADERSALTTFDHERKRRAVDERARKAVRRAKGMKRG